MSRNASLAIDKNFDRELVYGFTVTNQINWVSVSKNSVDIYEEAAKERPTKNPEKRHLLKRKTEEEWKE